ncbi:hypothetical protein EST38_g12739 [Candolleomyces aberdarensis]|uniref:Protein kinase domain-containing protein n=1 Tax=Candolleomyces aberdarensis TaxID=2316362 RepID=A0A4Q2D3Q8_9AGAR|nr:hypothetical protein EST38_g12739 [Candolleomyces aberdarensis]
MILPAGGLVESAEDVGEGNDKLKAPTFLHNVITVTDVLFSIAETIPVVGTPIKGALEALCKVLRLVELRFTVAGEIDELTGKLAELLDHLSKASSVSKCVPWLIRRLNNVTVELQRLMASESIKDAAIAQCLKQYAQDIDSFLIQFNARTNIEGLQKLDELTAIAVSLQREAGLVETITIIDPFGCPQRFIKTDMTNRELSQERSPSVPTSKEDDVVRWECIGGLAVGTVQLVRKRDETEEQLYTTTCFRKRRRDESEKKYIKELTLEFCISSTLQHPNIVKTVDLVQDEKMDWYQVKEFLPGGDLSAAISKGGMSQGEVECCFKQVLKGVSYLHSQGVAHRDLKPENLFFDARGQLKIGEYGAATVYRLPWETTVHMSSGLWGSFACVAPEQFLKKRKHHYDL